MIKERRYPLIIALVLLASFLPEIWAHGPKKEHFNRTAMLLTFTVQGMDATATFLKDEKGEVTQLIFHTPAGDLPAKRTDRLVPGGQGA